MNAKTRMNPRKRPLKSRERWQPLAKLGVNYRSFGLNEGYFRRKPLTRKELTKTRIRGEFIPNPDKDLRRKTTGGRPASFHKLIQESHLRRASEFDSQKYSQTKYNNPLSAGPTVLDNLRTQGSTGPVFLQHAGRETMGFVKRALAAVIALGLGALLVANWQSHGETQRKLDALVTAITGKPAEPVAPTTTAQPAEPRQLPPGLVVPASAEAPASKARPAIEPPDVLVINAVIRDPRTGQSERLPVQPINGEFLVRPDGTVSLGVWGAVKVAGLAPDRAAEEIRRRLTTFTQVNGASSRTESLSVTVEVKSNNSKVYYIITENGGREEVRRMPCTGRETVLDAMAAVPGLAATAERKTIRIIRMRGPGSGQQSLPVDWSALIQRGDTSTNYILQPEDRLYITGGR
jgi:polysaccharide biosynthesis/export protein